MIDKKQFYINGEWVEPSQSNDFEVINPQMKKFVPKYLLEEKLIPI